MQELKKSTEFNIMEVGKMNFAKNGYDGASIREICKMAGVNISMISYYFGGKQGLYTKIVRSIVEKIMKYMKINMGFEEFPENFDNISKSKQIDLLYKAIGLIIDFFYSDNLSESEMLILFKEQATSGVPLNATGYVVLKKLLASIMEKDENDKEIIFRAVSIVGQVHSARLFKQFSLNMMNQKQFSLEDTILFKQVVLNQVKAILKEVGAIDEE